MRNRSGSAGNFCPRVGCRGRAGCLAGSGGRRHLCGGLGAAEKEQEGQEEPVGFDEGSMRGQRLFPSRLGHLPSACPFPDLTNHLSSTVGLSMLQPLHVRTPVPLGLGGCGQPDCGGEAFLLLLPARQWATSSRSPAGGRAKGFIHRNGLFRVQEPVPFSLGLSRAGDQTLPTLSMP